MKSQLVKVESVKKQVKRLQVSTLRITTCDTMFTFLLNDIGMLLVHFALYVVVNLPIIYGEYEYIIFNTLILILIKHAHVFCKAFAPVFCILMYYVNVSYYTKMLYFKVYVYYKVYIITPCENYDYPN